MNRYLCIVQPVFKDHGNDCADTLPKRPLKQRWARINYTDFSNDNSAHWNRQLSRQLCITTRTNVSDKLPKDQLQGIQLGLIQNSSKTHAKIQHTQDQSNISRETIMHHYKTKRAWPCQYFNFRSADNHNAILQIKQIAIKNLAFAQHTETNPTQTNTDTITLALA